jgi:hypothetical protein
MKGYYGTGTGGPLGSGEQVVSELVLPKGKYLIFAKATAAISSRAPSVTPAADAAYQARLVASTSEDSYIGGLRYDGSDPGSRMESVALQIGVDTPGTKVSLRFLATVPDIVLVWNPSISAIEVDDLVVLSSGDPHREFKAIKKEYVLATAAMSGLHSLVQRSNDE